MIPNKPLFRNGLTVRPEEHQGILEQCRKCLVDTYWDHSNLSVRPEFAGWGWRYFWKPLERDVDGLLLIEIRIYDAAGDRRRLQRYRLISREQLIRGLG